MNEKLLTAILDWNPWKKGLFPKELAGFQRSYDLLDYLEVPEIKILEGARRTGKSTLMYQVIQQVLSQDPRALYINFDDEVLQGFDLETIVNTYLEQNEVEYLFIDEIQHCDQWVHYLRKCYDQKRFKQIWVSGSNSSLIKQEYAELLTGRNLTITIHPLSFSEYLDFKGINNISSPFSTDDKVTLKKHFQEYLKFGAMPAIATRNVLQKELLINYFEDFLYKDIVGRYPVNAAKLKELGIYLASNATKLFSYRNIAKSLNMHPNTVTEYCSYLSDIFLFTELYKFDYSLKTQMSHDKKFYALDTGIISAVSFKFSSDIGRMLENLIYSELKRRKHDIYFYRDKQECDFLIKQDNNIAAAIQVSYDLSEEKTKQREVKGLIAALETFKLDKGLILTMDEESKETIEHNDKTYQVNILPIWKWLLT